MLDENVIETSLLKEPKSIGDEGRSRENKQLIIVEMRNDLEENWKTKRKIVCLNNYK